jgi:hypothetical protein
MNSCMGRRKGLNNTAMACVLGLCRDLLPAPLLEVAQGYTGSQVAAHAVHTPTWWR